MKCELDPRTILAMVGIMSTAAVFTKHITIQLVILFFLLCLTLLFRIKMTKFIFRIRKMFPILVFVILMQSIFTEGRPLLVLFNLSLLSIEGCILGIKTFLRISILIFAAALFTLTSESKMIQGLRQMKMPDEIAFMTLISLRLLPTYVQEFEDAFTAVSLRGIEIKKLSLKRKGELIRYLFAPTMVRTLLKAKRLSMALDLKGFRASENRSSYFECQFTQLDYLVLSVSVILGLLWIGFEWRII